MIEINMRDARPIYEQIKDSFRRMILSGVLSADEKMPSVRSLATQLSINPNTIQRAYQDLEAEGYIYSVAGKGSFVCADAKLSVSRKNDLLNEFKKLVHDLILFGMTKEQLKDIIMEERYD